MFVGRAMLWCASASVRWSRSVNALPAVAGQIKQPGKGAPCSPAVAFEEDRYELANWKSGGDDSARMAFDL